MSHADPSAVPASLPQLRTSPSRLLTWQDCPRQYRFKYLDRPRPTPRQQRGHTSVGQSVHNALRDWWDLPPDKRRPEAAARLVRESWIEVGFRDPEQSAHWRERSADSVAAYVTRLDPGRQPMGVERSVNLISGRLYVRGRIDRLDDRDGELVIVDYKTSERPPGEDDARVSLPLALYAAAVWKSLRRECLTVELHHVPSGRVVTHTHTPSSLGRKVEQARSLAVDAYGGEQAFVSDGADAAVLAPNPSPLCRWCEFRTHCPQGQQVGPEQPDWAGLERDDIEVNDSA